MKNQKKNICNRDIKSGYGFYLFCHCLLQISKTELTQGDRYIPKRAGQINEETEYVLNRFRHAAAGISFQHRNSGERYGYPHES